MEINITQITLIGITLTCSDGSRAQGFTWSEFHTDADQRHSWCECPSTTVCGLTVYFRQHASSQVAFYRSGGGRAQRVANVPAFLPS